MSVIQPDHAFTITDLFWGYVNSLVQECSNSIANALELLQSCTKPSVYKIVNCWDDSCESKTKILKIYIMSLSTIAKKAL